MNENNSKLLKQIGLVLVIIFLLCLILTSIMILFFKVDNTKSEITTHSEVIEVSKTD